MLGTYEDCVTSLAFPVSFFAFLAVEGFADVFVNGQLELLALLELRANQFARVAEHLEKKPDLFVDRLHGAAFSRSRSS